MRQWLLSAKANAVVVGEIFSALWAYRKWWLIPMVVVLFAFGLLLVFASATGVGPFIYSLF